MRLTCTGIVLLSCLVVAPVQADPWVSPLQQTHPLVGRIWQSQSGRFVSADLVHQTALQAEFVLLGETHDNADHHRLQAALLAVMAAQGRRPAVVFEQIPTNMQPALSAYLAENPQDATGLGQAVAWQARGWPAWALYQPIAEVALPLGLPLVAADIPEPDRKAVGRGGLAALPLAERQRLGLAVPLPVLLQDDLAQELVASHCNMLPAAATAPMAGVQRARDAWLADGLVAGAQKSQNGAVLIAGAGHVRLDRAVPWVLRQRGEAGPMVVVAFREVQPDQLDPAAYAQAVDFVWFTPAAEREDPCARFHAGPGEGKQG